MNQPIPETVRQTWPEVRVWTWQSPLRLRGEHPNVPGAAYLVVIDQARTHATGQTIGADADPDRISRTYGQLTMGLMVDLAKRTACEQGTPIRADHDDARCSWCGLVWDEHETPTGDRPTRQATHINIGGQTITTTEAEAAIYIEMEAMKHRGRPDDDTAG